MTRKLSAHFGLHGIRQTQELGLEMVERKGFIIQFTRFSKGIIGIKQGNAQRP